jgi:hypothetical protein
MLPKLGGWPKRSPGAAKKSQKPTPKPSHKLTDQPTEAEGESPFSALRTLVAGHIKVLVQVQEEFAADPNLARHERFARSLNVIMRSARELFAADAAPKKSAAELKREDDAIRDEFARRLAAMFRAEKAGPAPGADAAPPSPEASS